MSAKAEIGLPTLQEIEQNLLETGGAIITVKQNGFRTGRETPGAGVTVRDGKTPVPATGQWSALTRQRDHLRNEIRRGREYLDQVEKELADCRQRLEKWFLYEGQCGRNPLPQLLQSIATNEHIARFLPNWLKQREDKLDALAAEVEFCASQNGAERTNMNGTALAVA